MEKERSFLGRGWKFPPAFEKKNGVSSVAMSREMEDIAESIRIILGTMPGERVMQPEFGCHMNKMVFEKIDTMFTTELNDIIYRALLHFEPRIKEVAIEVLNKSELDGKVMVNVKYTIIATNTRHNIVYPFYLEEGTNVG